MLFTVSGSNNNNKQYITQYRHHLGKTYMPPQESLWSLWVLNPGLKNEAVGVSFYSTKNVNGSLYYMMTILKIKYQTLPLLQDIIIPEFNQTSDRKKLGGRCLKIENRFVFSGFTLSRISKHLTASEKWNIRIYFSYLGIIVSVKKLNNFCRRTELCHG